MQTLAVCSAILAANAVGVNSRSDDADAVPVYLSDCSPRDKPWDVHRAQVQDVEYLYRIEAEFARLAERMSVCSGRLGFAFGPARDDPGVETLKLKTARFCRVRHCPVCQWRRSLMLIARFLDALPKVMEDHPTSRFLFLTLTAQNVPVTDLRDLIKSMNKAWDRFAKRIAFKPVQGWIRSTEVTREKGNGFAHPHFHVLLMVPSSYFKKHYVTQAEWTELWREAMRVPYAPRVDIRVVRDQKKKFVRSSQTSLGDVVSAARETLKYSVKPKDMTDDPDWFLELTRQVQRLRFLATGGLFKQLFAAEGKETQEELLLLGEGESEEPSVFFDWEKVEQRYKRDESDKADEG